MNCKHDIDARIIDSWYVTWIKNQKKIYIIIFKSLLCCVISSKSRMRARQKIRDITTNLSYEASDCPLRNFLALSASTSQCSNSQIEKRILRMSRTNYSSRDCLGLETKARTAIREGTRLYKIMHVYANIDRQWMRENDKNAWSESRNKKE